MKGFSWHTHLTVFPENPTGGTPSYDEKLWVYTCVKCGRQEPPASISYDNGTVVLTMPDGWKYAR